MLGSVKSLQAEESRIRAAYEKRGNGELYSRFNPAHLLLLQQREKEFLALLAQQRCVPLTHRTILEIGCGTGDILRDFIKWGASPANITGIDLLADHISEAIRLCPNGMHIKQANAAELDFPSRSFDLVVQSTVFTSVLDPNTKRMMASEMCRVLKDDGLILWYDFYLNNPRNPDVRGVTRREIHELFADYNVQLKRITLAPPLTRLIAPYSQFFCYLVEKMPFLCTHFIGVIRKKTL
jgi:ubiquinone/menaquinone biosynthesis C-methylase UbiE